MRLTYRGASYEYNTSSLEVRNSDILNHNQQAQRCRTLQENNYPLIYRGVQYTTAQVAAANSMPIVRTTQTLTYRGARYTRYPDGTIGAASERQVVPHTTTAVLKELSRVHDENIRRSLERRLQAAKQRGDQSLVSMLEAESKQLAL